jgi:hypothetical protein
VQILFNTHHRWAHIAKGHEVFPLLDGVFDIERKFETAPFSQIGSLYFKDDVAVEYQKRPLFRPNYPVDDDSELHGRLEAAKEKYRIGPIADRQWWRAERAHIACDRGPCKF